MTEREKLQTIIRKGMFEESFKKSAKKHGHPTTKEFYLTTLKKLWTIGIITERKMIEMYLVYTED